METQTLQKKKKGKFREYTESLGIALLAAFLIRSFVIEPFKIPSGSMIPTLVIGDHIFVNKFIYGLRIPFTKKKIVEFGRPQRGDPVVFIFPIDEGKDFIKRVVGLPGDRLRLQGDEIVVNGQLIKREETVPNPHPSASAEFQYYLEDLSGQKHLMQLDPYPSYEDREITVPDGQIFVMGDNRDNSSDSREWGFVPLENVKGKAMFVWLSIDFERKTLRWDRFGKWIR